MNGNELKKLEWDSKFFNKKIASISMNYWDGVFLSEALQKLQNEKYQLVYLFLNEGISLPYDYTQAYKCNLVDHKRIYVLDKFQDKMVAPNIVQYIGSASTLYDLAIQAGANSRFHIDPDFSNEDFECLYKTWVDKSLNGVMADYVLVYQIPGGSICGFITLKMNGGYMSIGLIATNAIYRRSGIGSALIDAAKHYAYNDGLFLAVATQAENFPACSFYERNGFVKQSQSTVYHIWL